MHTVVSDASALLVVLEVSAGWELVVCFGVADEEEEVIAPVVYMVLVAVYHAVEVNAAQLGPMSLSTQLVRGGWSGQREDMVPHGQYARKTLAASHPMPSGSASNSSSEMYMPAGKRSGELEGWGFPETVSVLRSLVHLGDQV